ncbi:MAG: hypothetical protein QOE45_3 [Frankiaceae bacterium]|jgi:Ca2+-binding RTX toxin-like protein|nr:hypothetical protein [Frankiaceae bacterium]
MRAIPAPRRRPRRHLTTAALAALAIFPAGASADTTVGTIGVAGLCGTGQQEGVGSAAMPTSGTVTDLAFQSYDQTAGAKETLQVLRPTGTPNTFTVVGRTGELTDPGTGAVVHAAVSIPVQAGDVVGVYAVSGGGPGGYVACWSQANTGTYDNTFAFPPTNPQVGDQVSGFAFDWVPNVQATLSTGPTLPKCGGETATIYRGSGYPGTSTAKANDPMTIKGTAGDDVIYAANGADTIDGAGGNDKICGVGGDDMIRSGAGNDYVFGSQGNDDLGGQAGDDEVIGGPGNDRVNGSDGTDVVRGGDGDDVMNGGNGDDRVYGGANDDVLGGNDGVDYCNGGGGNDRVTLNGGCETYDSSTVSNNTPAPNGADSAVVAQAESDSDAPGNAATLMPATDAGSGADVVGGNVGRAGDV